MIKKIKRKNKKNLCSGHLLLIFCLMMITLISGCVSGIKRYVRPDLDITNIKKVAVLPVQNLTSDKYAAEKVESMIIMELLSRGIDVMEPGEVARTLGELKVKSAAISVEDMKRVGKSLQVDALISGSVETFNISKGITVSYPEVSVNLRMHEAATGNIIWSVWHTTGGASFWTRHFGTEGRTLDETSKQVIQEAFDTFPWR
jgi:TolB-like protein